MMKKLRYLFSTFLLLLVAGVTWAAEETVKFSSQGYTNGQAIETYTGTNFSIAFDKGSNSNAPKYYTTGTAIRAYGGNTFTVTSSDNITKIVLTFSSGEGTNAITTDVDTYNSGTWSGSAKSVKFTIGGTSGHRRIASIAVTTESANPDVVGAPVFTVNGTTYAGSTGNNYVYDGDQLVITCDNADKIYYTTNGNSPLLDASGNPNEYTYEYTSPITISSTQTVFNAIGRKNSGTTGEVAGVVFLIKEPVVTTGSGTAEDPYTVADAVALLADGQKPEGVYVKGIVSGIVTAYNSQFGNISYNISDDGTTEADQLEAFRGFGLNNEWFTSEDDLLPGDEVVIFGNLTTYGTTKEFAQGNYLYSHNRNTPEVTKYYLNGSFNEWGEGIEFTYNASDNTYTLADQTLAAAAEVKISDSNNNWYTSAADGNQYWITADNHTNLQMVTDYPNTNYYFQDAGTYTFTISFTEEGAPLLTVTGWPAPTYYLVGSFDEWGAGVEFTDNGDGTFTATQAVENGTEFKVKVNNTWFGASPNGSNVVNEANSADIMLDASGSNFSIEISEPTTLTFTLTVDPTAAPTLTVTGWPQAPVVVEEGDYVKVTSTDDLVDGAEYLIVYEDGSVAFDGGLETLDAVGNTIDVTISDNTIKGNATVDAATFTIDVTTGTILSKSGKYIGQSSDANGLQAAADALTNTISIDEEGNAVILASGGAYLRFNSASNQDRFRYFKSASYTNQKAIQLYRKLAEVVAPVEYYLIGSFNEWNQETMVKFTKSGNTYTAEQAIEAGGLFKILDPNTGENGSWYGGPTSEETYNVNSGWYQDLPMATDGKNYQIDEAGTYTFTITVTDEAGPRLTVTGWPEPKYYLAGSFDGWGDGVEFTYNEDNNTYTATQAVENGTEFKVKYGFLTDPNNFTWYGGITDDGQNYRVHEEWFENIPLDNQGNNFVIEISEPTTLTFTLDPDALTLTVTGWAEAPVEGAEKYVLVTDASELAEGDEIIFVGQIEGEGYYSMNNAESANNRKASLITCDGTTATIGNDIVPYTLVSAANETAAMWMFKDADDKFLYAASSSSNQLKLTSDPDDNANATISIEDGVAYVEFQGSNTRSTMRFNPNNGTPLFACYASSSTTGSLVQIYKKTLLTTIDVTIGETGYATLYYSDMNLVVPEGVTATTYKVAEGSLTESKTYEPNDVIPAATGVVLNTVKPATYSFTITSQAGEADADNMLQGTDAATTISEAGYKYYILSKSKDGQKIGFYYQNEDGSAVNNGAHKAYLPVPEAAAGGAKGWSFDGEATGIRSIEAGAGVENAVIYNLSGVRMNSQNLPKGIYIVNGKKMVVK